MENKWYALIDRQDSDFEIGVERTRAEWKEWALKQARDSANIGLECVIMDISENDIIEYIDKTWELTLVTKKYEFVRMQNELVVSCFTADTYENAKNGVSYIQERYPNENYTLEINIVEEDIWGEQLSAITIETYKKGE